MINPTWLTFIRDFEPDAVIDSYVTLLQKRGVKFLVANHNSRRQNTVDKFLNDPVAIDYFFHKAMVTSDIQSQFRELPKRERDLIEMVERELKK